MSDNEKNTNNKREILFWLVISASIPLLLLIFENMPYGASENKDIFIKAMIFGGLVMTIPILSKQIFNELPIRTFVTEIKEIIVALGYRQPPPPRSDRGAEADFFREQYVRLEKELAKTKASESLIRDYIVESKDLAQRIFNRAGAYLMIGIIIAMLGVMIFYWTSMLITPIKASSPLELFLYFAPKFGVLFFIEFIALFFLKQYRVAMDEFRYYESIKRKRQEVLILLKIGREGGFKLDPLALASSNALFSGSEKLKPGETTEIIEAKKLEKDELEVLASIVQAITQKKN